MRRFEAPVHPVWATAVAIAIGACSSDTQLGNGSSDAGTDTSIESGRHESDTGLPTPDATPIDARVPEAGPLGPHCKHVQGVGNRIPACEGFDGGAPPLTTSLTCNPSSSFPFKCPDFDVAGTHLTGCCVYGSFSDCGLMTVRSDGQNYCGAFYPSYGLDPTCPSVTWGPEVLPGCRIARSMGGGCGVKLVGSAGPVTLEFGCVPENFLPRIITVDPG